MTVKIADDLLGSRGGDWEILATAAFVIDHRAADRVLHAAALSRPRPAGRLGQEGRRAMVASTMTTERDHPLAPDRDWWRGAVIYQIYPRSLPGLERRRHRRPRRASSARLPYVASLGVDAIWISPFFTSPMKDFGYDVSNYRDVDPMFGTLADFDALIDRAHDLGLQVMIDLVLSPHLRPAPLVPREPVEPRQPQGRLVRLGRRQARRHAAEQLAVDLRRLGLGVGHASACSTTCTTSSRAAGPQLPQPGGAGRAARRRRASGSSAASTASASTRSTSTSTTASCATTRCCRRSCATTRPRRRSTPTTGRSISTTRAGRR